MSTELFEPIKATLASFYKDNEKPNVLRVLGATFFGKSTDEKRLADKQAELAKSLVNSLEKLTGYGDDVNFEVQQKIEQALLSNRFFKSTLDSRPEEDAFEKSLRELLETNKSITQR